MVLVDLLQLFTQSVRICIFLGVQSFCVDGRGSGPVLVLEPSTKSFLTSNSSVTLRCAALGTPPPTITWIGAAGDTVTSHPGIREVRPDGSLWIAPLDHPGARPSPRATFRCRANNPSGTVISRSTTLNTLDMSKVSVSAEGSSVSIGGVGLVKCHVNEGYVGTVGGWVITTWLVQKSSSSIAVPILDAGRYVYGSDRTLYIQDVTEKDAHVTYRCRIRHRASQTPKTSTSAALKVTAPPGTESPPRIDQEVPRMLEVVEGRPFSIPCLAHAHPPAHYSWSRDGVSGDLGSVGLGMSGSSGRLWVRGAVVGGMRASAADAGGYTCVAANAAGTDTAHFTLTVIQELQVDAHPPSQTVAAGSRATIHCRVSGSPVGEVTWYKDGSLLHAHAHSHIMLQGRDTLVISTVGERDAGMYQCIAANSLGESQASSQLAIRDSSPTLRHTFIEQTIQPGPPMSLKCTALGHPTPEISWTLDGRPITPTNHYGGGRVSVGSWIDEGGQVVSQVNITRANHLDGGLYSCMATNMAGKVEHRARLNVYGPPTSRTQQNISVVLGSEATLVCPIAGYPLPSVSWMIHGRPLTPTARRSPRGDGTLVIQTVEADQDVGRYTCTVSNNQGRPATASFFLTVVKPPVLAELKFQEGIVEKMRYTLACSLMSGDLPINLRWTKDGKTLPQDPALSETHSQFFSNLVFSDIRARHAGQYTCTASNSAASTTVTASMNVRVPPSWVVEPSDVSVVGGEEVALECHAQGTPSPTVTWKRVTDGVGIEEGSSLVGDGWRLKTPRPGSLRIRDARAEDSGRYVCQAKNDVNPPISKTISLTVLEGARVENRMANVSAAVGDTLSVRCPARGDLPIAFSWSRDGIPLSDSPSSGMDMRTEDNGRTSVLVIRPATRDHAAVYSCQATNRYGSDSSTIFVNIVERPDPPAHVHVQDVTSRQVKLAWAPPFDGNSPLTHYLLQHWPARSHTQTPINTTLSPDVTEAVLKDLSPGTAYHVQVVAVNQRGVSPPSPTLSITTLQEPPTAPPTRLRVHNHKPGSITVTWQPPAPHLNPGEVTGYQIGYNEAEADDSSPGDFQWRSVKKNKMTAEVNGLRHYTPYTVTVRAVNSVGSGPSAQPVTIMTTQGVPSAAPDSVHCDPLSSQALRVRWNPLAPHLSNGPVQGYKVFYKRTTNILGTNPVEIKRTTNLETNLQGLGRFTNYSVRVLAYTAAGDGVISNPVFCVTLQDVPGAPPFVKALIFSKSKVMVSWLPPIQPNGVVIHYTLYYKPLNAHQGTRKLVVASEVGASPWMEISREVAGLDSHTRYEFWVKASTRVGEGQASRVVAQSPSAKVGAQIRSFGQSVEVIAGGSLTLPCVVIGSPPPAVTWTQHSRDKTLQPPSLPDNSLHVSVVGADAAGNYTCHAHNPNGRDEEMWVVKVVQTPPPPTLTVKYSTETSIHLSWVTAGNGGKSITGYVVRYTLESENSWIEENIEPGDTKHALENLRCGSTYRVQVAAVNTVGRGEVSKTHNIRTRGSAPPKPRHHDLISVNSSAITLHLYTWPTGGCPITWWKVEYRPHSTSTFTPLETNLPPTTDSFTIPELSPLTWYQLRITARNAAGSATATYDVATASLTGATLAPESVVEVVKGGGPPLYLDPHVLAPIVSGIACTLALLLCVGLLISRGRARFMKSDGGANQGSGSGGGNGRGGGGRRGSGPTYSRSLAELQNHRNDSQEQLSPAAQAKHDEAYSVEEPYEIYPYATFSVPPPSVGGGGALDYTLQFQTFGHQDCFEGQPQPPRSSSFMGSQRREGGTGPTPEIACISSQQTLPISAVAIRGRGCRRTKSGDGNTRGSDSEPDTSGGSPGAAPAQPAADTYKVPVRLRRGPDFTFHPPDSSTESNDERSPIPPRRPPHQQQQQQQQSKQQQPKQQQQQSTNSVPPHAHPAQHTRRYHAFTPAHTHVLRSNTLESVYSVEGAVGGPLRPPTGFSDSRELSEAECDRETGLGTATSRGLQPRRPVATRSGNDYSIHV